MFRPIVRSAIPAVQYRAFSQTTARPFLDNLFGKKEAKQRDDIIKNQDNFEIDADSKIVILDAENSPTRANDFDPERDTPGFKINQWKFQTVNKRDIRETFTTDILQTTLIETHNELNNGGNLSVQDFASTSLEDLNYRFNFTKLLQQKLGFDIKDYTISKSHNLSILFNELEKVINSRYTSERNPNAIALEKQDFTAPNVYLNEELSESAKERAYQDLVKQAREKFENENTTV